MIALCNCIIIVVAPTARLLTQSNPYTLFVRQNFVVCHNVSDRLVHAIYGESLQNTDLV